VTGFLLVSLNLQKVFSKNFKIVCGQGCDNCVQRNNGIRGRDNNNYQRVCTDCKGGYSLWNGKCYACPAGKFFSKGNCYGEIFIGRGF